jgi:hypothetical protein
MCCILYPASVHRNSGVQCNFLLPDLVIFVGQVMLKNICEGGKEKQCYIVCTKRNNNFRDDLRKNKDYANIQANNAFSRKYAQDSKYFLGNKYFSRMVPFFHMLLTKKNSTFVSFSNIFASKFAE